MWLLTKEHVIRALYCALGQRERGRERETDIYIYISFHRAVGVRQGCSLSPTLLNIYINELARAIEQSAAPGLILLESEVKCLLSAEYLDLRSPTKEDLQQHLDLLHRVSQIWALTVNLSKTKVMVLQKRSSCQVHKYKLNLDTVALEHRKKTIHTSA